MQAVFSTERVSLSTKEERCLPNLDPYARQARHNPDDPFQHHARKGQQVKFGGGLRSGAAEMQTAT
jgi:hypothetical protein